MSCRRRNSRPAPSRRPPAGRPQARKRPVPVGRSAEAELFGSAPAVRRLCLRRGRSHHWRRARRRRRRRAPNFVGGDRRAADEPKPDRRHGPRGPKTGIARRSGATAGAQPMVPPRVHRGRAERVQWACPAGPALTAGRATADIPSRASRQKGGPADTGRCVTEDDVNRAAATMRCSQVAYSPTQRLTII